MKGSYFGFEESPIMHARLPIRFRTNDTVIDTCIVFIAVYFNINGKFEATACHCPSLNDVADVC